MKYSYNKKWFTLTVKVTIKCQNQKVKVIAHPRGLLFVITVALLAMNFPSPSVWLPIYEARISHVSAVRRHHPRKMCIFRKQDVKKQQQQHSWLVNSSPERRLSNDCLATATRQGRPVQLWISPHFEALCMEL